MDGLNHKYFMSDYAHFTVFQNTNFNFWLI